jgi:Tol biopolymer transport system component
MALTSGIKLGPYEILSSLGSGGMGEVYRARDTRLERTVAIKVLPAHLSSDPVRKQRFEREARTISSLNHPHICVLHDIGHQDGMDYLVMECVEGETLEKRLEKGPLPLEQVVKIGAEVADALDKAHCSGVVHRDLKPGNVMLTATGAKLLDFGLAKPAALAVAATVTASAKDSPVTEEGTIVGTFQYMSPEQVGGKEVDGRSDIFSLGAVLYEMVTGKKAFEGESQLSVASAILEKEPAPISAIKPMTPPALDHAVKKCLAKAPDERWQSASDLASELKWIAESGSQAGVPAPAAERRRTRERLGWVLAAALLVPLIATMAVTVIHLREKPSGGPAARFHFAPPEKGTFGGISLPVVSPDGQWIAFRAFGADGLVAHLWVRSLDSLNIQMLPGTEGATSPFWSSDSKSIAFFASGELKRIDLAGSPPQTLCDALGGIGAGAWSQDDVILFRPDWTGPLYRVSATGGEPKPVTELDPSHQETYHAYPEFLPDGHHFLFYIASSQRGKAGIYVGSVDSKEKKRVLDAASKAVYASGYLLYARGNTLTAQRFDWKRLELVGEPVPVGQQVAIQSGPALSGTAFAAFSVSQNGVLAYRTASGGNTQLTWFDRHGNRGSTVGTPAEYSNPSLSSDGSRLAVGREDPQTGTRDLWIFDLKRGTSSRLTSDPADDLNPVWNLDGSRIFFTSNRKGARDIYEKPTSGIGDETVLLESKQPKSANDVSLDGQYLVYDSGIAFSRSVELWILPLFGDRKPFLFAHSGESPISQAKFSPNSHFIAYSSSETGQSEVYVQTFPEARGKWQISTEGGSEATWRRDGKELFYIGQKKLMAVEVKTDANLLQAGIPQALFEIPLLPTTTVRNRYVVTSDGQRFLFNVAAEVNEASMINVVVNWTSALKK